MTPMSSSLRALRTVLGSLAAAQASSLQAEQSARLRDLVEKQLPGTLAGLYQTWLEPDGILVIACSSGAVAAKLKQLTPRLLTQIRYAEPQVSSIKVEVQASAQRISAAKRPVRVVAPPPTAAAGLEQAADRITAPGLAAAMRRLAGNLRQRSDPSDS